MYPNQQNPSRPGAPFSSPYPQQPSYNPGGAYPQQQHSYNNNPSAYGSGSGPVGSYPQNMSAPYGGSGNNPGMFGGIGNPHGQGSHPPVGNPYAQGSNPPAGNPYAQGGYGMSSGTTGPAGYPPNPSGQQPFGNNPYNQNPSSGYGSGYPPSSGGYPPAPGGYPPQTGGYPPQAGGYPPQTGSGYPPNTAGGYPGQQQPYPPQGGAYPGPGSSTPAMGGFGGGAFPPNSQRLNQVIQQYEINPQFAARLQTLANCEIVVLCDDSGSMNTPLQGTGQTRWDELKQIVRIVVDIASTMDSNGVDVYFLNREPVMNVTNIQNMLHVFNSPPQGLTPLVPALRRILASKRSQTFEKKLLILVATDGAPTNEHGQTDIRTLEAVLRQERTPQTYVTFLACTDDLESVSYLSQWDRTMPNLDVIDDYRSERTEIQQTRGANFPFSYGDYIVKSLLGSMDPWFDSLDDRA